MKFIIEQQAKFSVDMDLMKEAHEQRMKEIDAAQAVHQGLLGQFTEAGVHALKVIAQPGKAKKQTADRLTILINVVEGHISKHNSR